MDSRKQKATMAVDTASSHTKTSHLLLYLNTDVRTTRIMSALVTSHCEVTSQGVTAMRWICLSEQAICLERSEGREEDPYSTVVTRGV